jgi:hypothetical protein
MAGDVVLTASGFVGSAAIQPLSVQG